MQDGESIWDKDVIRFAPGKFQVFDRTNLFFERFRGVGLLEMHNPLIEDNNIARRRRVRNIIDDIVPLPIDNQSDFAAICMPVRGINKIRAVRDPGDKFHTRQTAVRGEKGLFFSIQVSLYHSILLLGEKE